MPPKVDVQVPDDGGILRVNVNRKEELVYKLRFHAVEEFKIAHEQDRDVIALDAGVLYLRLGVPRNVCDFAARHTAVQVFMYFEPIQDSAHGGSRLDAIERGED